MAEDYWFDAAAADRAVAFFPTHLRLTEGEWAGRPFTLEPWQANDIIRPLFGWKRADGTRRYRRCFVWVPRKNGKTELAAGIALLMLLGDAEPGGQVFSIAADKAQAAIVFNKASIMAARSPALAAELEILTTALYCPRLNASFRPLSGKPQGKHGLSMSGLIGDEVHEWRNGDLYTFVHDSGAARRQPLEFVISTAGVKGSHGEVIWQESQAIAAGEVDDPETLVVIYAANPEDDWTSPEVWRKANPNFGVSVKPDAFAQEALRAQQLPRLEGDFRRYRLNQWTDQASAWLPIDALDEEGRKFGWDHCVGTFGWRDLPALMAGRVAYAGLDLSSTSDLSALVWRFEAEDPNLPAVLIPRFFTPADTLRTRAKRDKLPYEDWVREGALIATPGNVVDYAYIEEQIYRDAQLWPCAGLAIDRWNATQTAVRLQQEGLPVELFGQGFASMSGPSKELERRVLGNLYHHGGHPVLRAHARAAACETDAAGNLKPAKHKSSTRIDGIVAAVMAEGLANKAAQTAALSPYEDPTFSIRGPAS